MSQMSEADDHLRLHNVFPCGIHILIGRIEDTLDALIIFEGCRQGILPTLNRRLLAAERGDMIHPLPLLEAENDNDIMTSSGDHSRRAIDDIEAAQSSKHTSGSRGTSRVTPKDNTASNPLPLIIPGSVFVFDEGESGICRWTDGRIWSPSRICGNFLVYRELLRKVPSQKCRTPSDKARMKNGGALKDQVLKQKVEKDGLTVMGSMKGTFVLKKDGLIKKTICVKGATVPMPGDLRRLQGKRCNKNGHPPGFAVGAMQHLVCYERAGGNHFRSCYCEVSLPDHILNILACSMI
jgi:hypothetical protein